MIIIKSTRIVAASLESLKGFFDFVYSHAAARLGIKSQDRFSLGNHRWNDATAFLIPDSALILLARLSAAAAASAERQNRIASASASLVRVLNARGFGPAPALATMSPQKGWLGGVNITF